MIFSNFKRGIVFLILILCAVLINVSSYVYSFSNDISSSVFRLHIIANSDSKEDQDLKLKVRDAILNEMNKNNFSSKEDSINYCKNHLADFESIAKNVILENGFNYDVHAEVGNFYFPTKKYGDVSFPAGFYDGLNIKIGKAEGHNWWCVMFPPLCFYDENSMSLSDDSKSVLKNELSDEEFNVISSDKTEYKIKFKLVEIFNEILKNS